MILKNNWLWFRREIEFALMLDESTRKLTDFKLISTDLNAFDHKCFASHFWRFIFLQLKLFICSFGRLLGRLDGCGAAEVFYRRWCKTTKSDWYLCFNTFYLDRDLCNSLLTSSVSFGCFSARLIYSRGVNCVCVWLKLHIHKFYNDNATTVTVVVIDAVTYTGAIV